MSIALGLGGAGIGNLYRPVSDADAIATVDAALGAGFAVIDTAPYYGHGRSERRIGTALARWRGARPAISSKVGRVLDAAEAGEEGDFGFADPLPYRPRFDYSRDGVRRSLEGSFERLGVERLDIALVHDVGAATHGDAHSRVLRQVLDETLPELADAQARGEVGAIGIGVNEGEVCFEILERAPLDVILLAGRYTVLEQPALTSGLLDLCATRGVRVMAAGVFNSGLLATRPRPESTYNYAPAPNLVLERARQIWALCEQFDAPPQAVALQFAGAHPAVGHVIVGARARGEIEDAVRWSTTRIPGELWAALKRAGLIVSDAPTPA